MSEQQKPTTNAEAEKDVQNVLAELKENSAPEQSGKDDAEEARIVAEAAKLGEKSEKSEEKSQQQNTRDNQRGGRGGRFARNKSQFDPSTLKETDDPVEIRKQVCAQSETCAVEERLILICLLG